MPASAIRESRWPMKGTPAVGSIGFGVEVVSGRSRLPCPPTSTTAAVRPSAPPPPPSWLPSSRPPVVTTTGPPPGGSSWPGVTTVSDPGATVTVLGSNRYGLRHRGPLRGETGQEKRGGADERVGPCAAGYRPGAAAQRHRRDARQRRVTVRRRPDADDPDAVPPERAPGHAGSPWASRSGTPSPGRRPSIGPRSGRAPGGPPPP